MNIEPSHILNVLQHVHLFIYIYIVTEALQLLLVYKRCNGSIYEMYSSCKTSSACTSFVIKRLHTCEIAFIENLNSMCGERIRMHMCQ